MINKVPFYLLLVTQAAWTTSLTEDTECSFCTKTKRQVSPVCKEDEYQCADGSCIPSNKRCDGIADCTSGSDEEDTQCNKAKSKENVCILPDYPNNGRYVVNNAPGAVPGQPYATVLVNVSCDPGYRVKGDSVLYCFNGLWSKEMPQCVQHCRLHPHPSVSYQCIDDDSSGLKGTRNCDDYEPSGTLVKPECQEPNYYYAGVLSYMRCVGNAWDYVAICLPECGTITPKAVELIAHGRDADRGEIPWFAGVYSKKYTPYKLLCGGSIISATAVVTAGHCIWYENERKAESPSNFAVAAGKRYRPWRDPRDEEFAQKRDVKRIALPPRFQGHQTNYQADIGILILSAPFEFKSYLKPICLNFDNAFNSMQLKKNNLGMIAGWGLTETGQVSTILQVVQLPYIDINSCLPIMPSEFRRFITSDKVCMGYTNGTAACLGDSGSGIAYPETDRGVNRFYLRGILSVAPATEQICNLNSPAGFTEVIKYQDFIGESLSETKWRCADGYTINMELKCDGFSDCPDGSDEIADLCEGNKTDNFKKEEKQYCVLPEYPTHGSYSVAPLTNATAGMKLQEFDLTVKCDHGYLPSGPATVTCEGGDWSAKMAQCIRFCSLKPHPSVEYMCFNKNASGKEELQICDTLLPDGTLVKAVCRAPLYYTTRILRIMRCVDGLWDSIETCTPECGTVLPNVGTSLKGKHNVTQGELPWIVGIYTTTTIPYTPICGGSIVSQLTVITAAHCFGTDSDSLKPVTNYAVAAGKVYRPWDSPQDNEVQKRTIKKINIPPRYLGAATNFQDDIAVVILKTPFMYTIHIRPVCLDFDINFNRHQLAPGNLGRVGGWGLEDVDASVPSQTLKSLDLPYMPITECYAKSPPQFREYITADKICAGLMNGTSVCRGDGGGGLAFPELDKIKTRYYLRGIFSTAPVSNDEYTKLLCNTFSLITFTEIIKHEQFIKQFIEIELPATDENEGSGCKDGEQFRCDSGDCIDLVGRCNNITDCLDGSDESKRLCSDTNLNKQKQNSIEVTTTTEKATTTPTTTTTSTTTMKSTTTVKPATTIKPTSTAKCTLPPQPENGVYHVSVGDVVDGETSFAFLDYSCYPRFAMKEDPKVFCWAGKWSTESLPKCLQTCYLERHESMVYNCIIDGKEETRTCNDYEVEGTVIQPMCKEPNYYTPLELPYMVCKRGRWNFSPSCVPECGTLTPKGAPLVLGGEDAKFGDVPWHAGIYYKNLVNGTHDQICGGSLISNSVVLSAAHCFWDEKKKCLNEVKNYAVAVGKLYRDWNNPGDKQHAQKSDVKNIYISKYYYGRDLNFRDDIAVVVVSGPFEYQTYVRPICLDFRYDFAENQLRSGSMGKAAGWGLTTGYKGSESEELKVIDMPYVSYVDCVQRTSPVFKSYITHDKICAGDTGGLLLCRGDSGGGLAFPATVDNTLRFYLRGIASTSPPSTDNKLCNTEALTGFTAISKYQNLIKTHWLT